MNTPLLILPLVIATFFIVLLIFQWLWNSTLPDLFGWKAVSLWTAFKLLLLAMLIFGGGVRLPWGYSESSTRATGEGETKTTRWSVGDSSK